MARARSVAKPKTTAIVESNENSSIDTIIKSAPKEVDPDINSMPLNSLEDYIAYNKKARELNHKLKINRYPIKPCPVELHPKERVIFARKDQPLNPLPVYKSDEMIDFKMTLEPGKTYDLPVYIIQYLAEKGTPIWKWRDNPDGSKETFKAAKDPRFALRTVYKS